MSRPILGAIQQQRSWMVRPVGCSRCLLVSTRPLGRTADSPVWVCPGADGTDWTVMRSSRLTERARTRTYCQARDCAATASPGPTWPTRSWPACATGQGQGDHRSTGHSHWTATQPSWRLASRPHSQIIPDQAIYVWVAVHNVGRQSQRSRTHQLRRSSLFRPAQVLRPPSQTGLFWEPHRWSSAGLQGRLLCPQARPWAPGTRSYTLYRLT